MLPVLDTLIGKDSSNPPDSVLAGLEGDRYYRWCVYLFVPLRLAALAWACAQWSSGAFALRRHNGAYREAYPSAGSTQIC